MAAYFPGSISASLSATSTSKEGNPTSSSGLSALFNDSSLKKFARVTKPQEFDLKRSTVTTTAARLDPVAQSVVDQKALRNAAKKAKRGKTGASVKKSPVENEEVMDDLVGTSKSAKSDAEKDVQYDKNDRTIFLGNVPTSETVKSITKMCTEFGEVESVRLRSVPVAGTAVDDAGNQSLVKKVCSNKRDFGSQKGSLNAYVVFQQRSAVQKALSANNRLIGGESGEGKGRHLRVDLMKPTLFDPKRTVFVGGVPHYADEEEVRAHFAAVLPNGQNDIENIRLVRDAETLIGKGFGYLLLSDSDAVMQALTLHKAPYRKRWELRVTVCGKRTKRTEAAAHSKQNTGSAGGKDSAARGQKRKQGDSETSTTAESGESSETPEKAKKMRWRDMAPEDVPKRDTEALAAKAAAGAAKRLQKKMAKQVKALKTVNTRKKVLTERGQIKKDGRKGKRLGGNVKKAMKAAKLA
jgi:nucleolar protein 12